MKMLYDLKEKLYDELKEFAKKERMSSGDYELLRNITSSIKNIGKICIMEEEGGEYSHAGEWEADMRGSYSRGNSYRRRHYVRGHYSRDGGMSNEGGRGGNSYRGGGYSRDGGYSREGGYSGHGGDEWKEEAEETLEELMRYADDDHSRDAIRRCLEQVKRG